ncbi:MAG TPA: cell division protein FtsZ [Bacteroidales bacterium]|nr:cell division protein FtsZ [Bacteroidales bacterium]HOE03710.1 cell division protein FtsZ [Bacteroidales bacterium]HQL69464.1 cell division protein FtsZ [Bacteroidales bacterium]
MLDLDFGIEKQTLSIIKVIGVGGGGGNAVNQMYKLGIRDVDFVICNTDVQALKSSPVVNKIQLGQTLTEGLGAGNNPERGREAAIESLHEIEEILENNTKMVFITAGMGGGTGTGAAPVIAKAAKDRGILTVGIVSVPFKVEGPLRINQAIEGIKQLEQHVDSLLIINNERLQEIFRDFKMSEAFSKADEVLATAAKGIAEIITVHGYINVDFEDVRTVMKDSGVALMGSAISEGENRAINAIKDALNSPLLKDNDIRGAKNILLNIMSGTGEFEIKMSEFGAITNYVTQAVGTSSNIIWGTGFDENLNAEVRVTVIATGFKSIPGLYESEKKFVHVPFGQNIPPTNPTTEEEKADEIIFSSDDDDDESPRTVEFIINSKPDNHTHPDNLDDDDLDQINSDPNQFKHVKDLNKLNDSSYLESLENEPAYKRLLGNQNLSLDFDNDKNS